MKFQTQAVLRRDDSQAPLRLAGVLLAGSFYPRSIQDAWGPLHLEAGLVALAPLTPVVMGTAAEAAGMALVEACRLWAEDTSRVESTSLSWRPIRDVRGPLDGQTVRELIALMSTVNDARLMAVPSTPRYHTAARELERLAVVMYDTTSGEERAAEDAALLRDMPPGRAGQDA